jgi:hypothetical protein
MFDPLLDPILDGDPDEEELAERMAVYDAYMGLFDVELDRVLFRHGMLPTDAERSRIKWIVARFMQAAHTSDLDAIEPVLLEHFLPREQEFRLLDQELDWVIDRYEPGVTPDERREIREWVTEYFDANVLLGLVDLERIYVSTVIPNRLLERHIEELAARIAALEPHLVAGERWPELARWMETAVATISEAHTEETGARAVRTQAMQFPSHLIEPLVAWASRPESILYGAAGLRLVLSLRESGSREDLLRAFRHLDRFWKIALIKRGGPEQAFWSKVLKDSTNLL